MDWLIVARGNLYMVVMARVGHVLKRKETFCGRVDVTMGMMEALTT